MEKQEREYWVNRTREMVEDSIGCEIKIRTSKTSTVTGTITRAEFFRTRTRARSVIAQFRIWMVAGPAKVSWGPFIVERLPRF